MMYSLVTTSHVQYPVMNDLHYFKTEHKASEHILSVNIPQPIRNHTSKIQFGNIFSLQRNTAMSLTVFAHSPTKFLSQESNNAHTVWNAGKLYIPSGFVV